MTSDHQQGGGEDGVGPGGGGRDDSDLVKPTADDHDDEEEDLICDAVEAASSEDKDLSTFKGCLRSCCPNVLDVINDLRKVKVAEVVSKKATSLGAAVVASGEVMGGGGPEPELDIVIERVEDIRKPKLDPFSYR